VLKSAILGISGTNTGADPFQTYITSIRKGTGMVGAVPLHEMEATGIRRFSLVEEGRNCYSNGGSVTQLTSDACSESVCCK
jgi:hypothetical protein